MIIKASLKLAILGVFTLSLVSCTTLGFGSRTVDIHGMIYDFSNRPIPHYEISLGRQHRTTTDINGRFTLPRVPIGIHTLTGQKRGFESYSGELIISGRGQIVYLRIPSQNQLLTLVDEALTVNDLMLANEMVERAFQIDRNNIEMLFYYATVKFRQRNYTNAIYFLESAINLGSRDLYVERFLFILKESQNAAQTN